jgi:hypothetical protein
MLMFIHRCFLDLVQFGWFFDVNKREEEEEEEEKKKEKRKS